MYAISDGYKNLLDTKLAIKSRSKVVIDNVEYISELKSYPKISHKDSTLIGGFPIKTCTFELYDVDNSLDVIDKEIYVYRGIEVDGVMEWVPQGIFIPTSDKVTTNVSTKSINFSSIQDKGQFFDVAYKSDLDWSTTHTGLEIVQEVCDKVGITLETTDFNWSTYSFKQPNFDTNTTYREVINRIAEIGGSIAYISRTGGLVIKSQYSTGHSINNNRYVKLSKENQFGTINVVVLGKDGADDDIYYPTELPTDKIEWKILDNPFVDLYRDEMIEQAANYIIGQSIIPFELTNVVDGFYLDLNDVVEVSDKNGDTFNAVILNYESSNRLMSTIGADVQTESTTDYNLAGSTKKTTAEVKAQVDHINNEIIMLAENVSEVEKEIQSSSTATGNPIEITDAGNYELQHYVKYGKCYQDGTPTVDNSIDIQTVTGEELDTDDYKGHFLIVTTTDKTKTTSSTSQYIDLNIYDGETITGNYELCSVGDVCDYIEDDTLHKLIGKIDSYNGEEITTDYISTTGELSTGATVYYVLDEEITYDLEYDMLTLFEGYNLISDNDTLLSTMEIGYLLDTELNGIYTTRSEYEQTTDRITQEVSSTTTSINELNDKVDKNSDDVTTLESRVSSLELTSEELNINFVSKETLEEYVPLSSMENISTDENGKYKITEVETSTGFTFNKEGMKVSSSETHINATIAPVGLSVNSDSAGDGLYAGYNEATGDMEVKTNRLTMDDFIRWETFEDENGKEAIGAFYVGG